MQKHINEHINERNSINVIGELMDIQSEISRLNTKIDDMKDVHVQAEQAHNEAVKALNQAQDNANAIKDLKDKLDHTGSNHLQWWVAVLDFAGCVLSGFIGNFIS